MADKLKEKTTRVKRTRIEQAGPLYIDDKYNRDGFRRRIVADRPGQIRKYEKLGYTIVTDETLVGDQKAGTTTRLGSAVTVDLGRTHELKGVLMEIPEDIYQEIQAEKAEEYDEIDRALAETGIPQENQYGEIKLRERK